MRYKCYEPTKPAKSYENYFADLIRMQKKIQSMMSGTCSKRCHQHWKETFQHRQATSLWLERHQVSMLSVVNGTPTDWKTPYMAIKAADELIKIIYPEVKTIITLICSCTLKWFNFKKIQTWKKDMYFVSTSYIGFLCVESTGKDDRWKWHRPNI